jgi:CRP-like cAMP-binding protein
VDRAPAGTSSASATIAALLAERFPVLGSRLDEAGLRTLAGVLRRVEAGPGEEIHRQGQRVPSLLFLLDGTFALRLGDEQGPTELGFLPAYSIVGEVSFFDGGPATATILACAPRNSALALDAAGFERLAADAPGVAAGLCRAVCDTLAARLREADDRFDRIQLPEPDQPDRPGAGGFLDLLATLFGLRRKPGGGAP